MIVHVRHRRGRRHGVRRVALSLLLGVVVFGGTYYLIQGHRAPTPTRGPAAPSAQSRAYSIRGQIAQLPDPSRPSSSFDIRHEPISDFQRKDGTLGMASMTMSFPVASGVSLNGLTVGDKIAFTFEVNWGGSPIFQITRIEKLAPETELSFDAAQAPAK